jgi:4a-hydroxytetrahydrobiopterin dehydratase
MKVYDENEIINRLANLNGWEYIAKQIQKSYSFRDFKSAMEFVNKVAVEAENMNHHPDIFIHSWNKVQFILSTHSAKGITDNDFNLAQKIDQMAVET